VHASTVNRTDCGFRRPEPVIVRAFSGLLRPRRRILGSELAGEVEAIGGAVSEFAVGDRVFGVNANRLGAHAEYVCVAQRAPIATMPSNLSFEQAAAVCDGAILALTYLRRAAVGAGRRILIYGASGSIGTAAVQLARQFGAHVTAVCSTANLDTVRSLGADELIDYTHDDFTNIQKTYDVVLDAVGKLAFARCKGCLVDDGNLHEHRPRSPLAEPGAGAAHVAQRREEGALPAPPVHQAGRAVPQRPHRGRELPGGDRSRLSTRAGRRGDPVRRERAEDR
jgi:NADPH:quinone reductase-like Zn-dependent oxidoreductase